MATPFTYPNTSIVTNLMEFISYTNEELLGGWLGAGILIIVGFITFLAGKTFGSYERAFGSSTFLVLITAVFLRFLGWINDTIFYLSIVIFIIALIMLIRERNVEET